MNAREVITEELRYMGSLVPHAEAGNIMYRLSIEGFDIIPRSEVEAKDKEIAALREALEDVIAIGGIAEGNATINYMVRIAHRALEGSSNATMD